jgi:asparagine synthetase B (glutamine-hydrolysing)
MSVSGHADGARPIVKLSEVGRTPLASPDGFMRSVFTREVYNIRELRAEPRASLAF